MSVFDRIRAGRNAARAEPEPIEDNVEKEEAVTAETDMPDISERDEHEEKYGVDLVELLGGVITTSSGEIVTPENALRNIGVVFACVDRRARALAKLPLQVYRKNGKQREQVFDHPVSQLLARRPNKYQTPTMFKQFIVASQLLWGNAYVLKEYNLKGQITALLPLYPSEVSIEKLFQREEYIYRYNGAVYTEDEIIHIPYLSGNGKVGISPLRVARETVGNIQAMNKHQGAFYKNGALKQGALVVPSVISPENKQILRREWEKITGGAGNAGRVAVLDGGMDWKDISMPLADAEFVATKKLSAAEIATIFNVSSYMINDTDKMTYANMEQQNHRWMLDVVQPDCINIEEEFDYKLFLQSEADLFVKFNLSSGMRADPKARAAFYKEMIGSGIYSVNDVLALEDMDGIGELGDKHYMSLNYTTLETLEKHQRLRSEGGDDEEIKTNQY